MLALNFTRVCMYLRKSRADEEAERRGEGETLSKHKNALLKFAKQSGINIVKIRMEIVSGESLMHRPEMLELLKDVELGEYDAVLVMDVDRLGRGNMQEQGLILETFRNANTRIVTPRKVYDLNNEFDEEYSEFEAFMARKELKLINRRLQGGRVRSVEEGNYIGTRPPYGYLVHKTDRERFLVPHPEQASVVRLIFEMYTTGMTGSNKIANELNRLGYKTYENKLWSAPSVLTIIKNAVYIGRIQWKKKEQKKSKEPGKLRDTRTRPTNEWIDVTGKHEPLITEEIYKKAQDILKGKYHVPYQLENGITNPLAGLIRCDMCGSSMVLRPYTSQPAHLMCTNRKECINKSSRFSYVEEKLIKNLELVLSHYKNEFGKRKPKESVNVLLEAKESALRAIEKELIELEGQKGTLHDYLERKIYDVDTYLQRSQNLAERIDAAKRNIEQIQSEIAKEKKKDKAQKNIIPNIEKVLKLYWKAKTAEEKNRLLKSILDYSTYRKEKHQKNDEFTLTISPRLGVQYR